MPPVAAWELPGVEASWCAGRRPPGAVGMSLMVDAVEMSVRDLLVPMMTISDNVATDALLHTSSAETS